MGNIFRLVDSFLKIPSDNRELTAVVPTEVVQRHERSLPRPDVGDLGEDYVMVSLIQHLEEVALDPAGAVHEHGQARGSGLGLHLLEGTIEHALREVLHSFLEK